LLSLAAERAKEWYRHPQKCHALNKGTRQTRSERREAYQIILETMLSFLDLASLCLGTPTLDNGFVDMRREVGARGPQEKELVFQRYQAILDLSAGRASICYEQ